MSYVDGCVASVSTADKERYRDYCKMAADVFKEHGALHLVDCWGDDVPHGEVTDFYRAVHAGDGETVVFSWIVWPDKAARDAGMEKVMSDPRFDPATNPMPFDGKRLIFGGFEPVVVMGEPGEAVEAATYVDGFVLAVPAANKEKFCAYAKMSLPLFEKHGALSTAECWGQDVPRGELTDFYRAVDAKDDESIVFSWIVWPDKATRDAGMEKMMSDPVFDPETNPMPLDGKRMIFGGFERLFAT